MTTLIIMRTNFVDIIVVSVSLAEDNGGTEVFIDVNDIPLKVNEGFIVTRHQSTTFYNPICLEYIESAEADQVCNTCGFE